MTSACLVVFLTCLLSALQTLSTSPLRDQESGFLFANVGEDATLSCFYDTNEPKTLAWYKHTPGLKPHLVSTVDTYSKEVTFVSEFSNTQRFTLKKDGKSSNLTILNVRYTDSATFYCVEIHAVKVQFRAAITLIVRRSALNLKALVDPSWSESVRAGDSVTLNCTVHAGSCDDGGHRVYWFKDSEDSRPGLIYTHGGGNDQCEKNTDSHTHSCVYSLPMEDLDESQAGTYYCAVASCGHILFGNGTKVDFEDDKNLVIILSVSLIAMSVLVLLLLCCLLKSKTLCCFQSEVERTPGSLQADAQNQGAENLHYAALTVKQSRRTRRHRDAPAGCVYAIVQQLN